MRTSRRSFCANTYRPKAFLAFVFALLAFSDAQASVPIFGPKAYTVPQNQELTFSETVAVPPGPCATDSAVYTLLIVNGNGDGSGKLKTGSVTLNGQALLTDEIQRGLATIEKPVVLTATNSLSVRLSAADSTGVASITLRRQMTTAVFAEKTFSLSSGGSASFREDFSLAPEQPGPYTLILTNGVGSDLPVDDVSLVLNGTEVISKKDIASRGNNNIAQVLLRTVSLEAQNALRLDLKNNKVPASVKLRIVRPVVDTAGPVITLTSPQNSSVESGATVTVAGTAADPIGVASLRVNTAAVTLAADGSFTRDVDLAPGANRIAIDATDCEGNASHGELTVFRDVAPPLIVITAPLNNAILAAASVSVTGTATDDIGVASVVVNGQPATITASAWSVKLTFPAIAGVLDGTRQITAMATDRSGKQAMATVAITIDTTQPTITASVAPTPNAAGWNHNDVTVSFVCADSGSGVATCSAPSTITAESSALTVTGTAVDKAGNTRSISTSVKLDKTAPIVTAVVTPAPNGAGWNNTDATVRFDAVDSRSGIASVTPPAVVSTEGAGQRFSGSATDLAGNVSAPIAASVNLDKSGPLVTLVAPLSGSTLSSTAQSITGTVIDALSGVQSVRCGTSAATIAAGAFTCAVTLVEGPNDVTILSTDNAGNITTAVAHYTVSSDLQPPVITITSPASATYSNVATVDVTGTATDDKAVAGVTVNGQPATLVGANWTATLTFVALPAGLDGVRQITAVARDTSGKETSGSVSITIDTTPPVIVYAITPLPNAGGWNNTDPTITFRCSDATSGVDTCGAPVTLTEDGQRPVRGLAIDKAGNVTVINVDMKVDKTRPQIQAVSSPDASSDGWFWAPVVSVGFICNDGGSGITSCGDTLTFTSEGAGQIATGTATDAAGNQATVSLTVNADRTAPTLTVTSPGDVVATPQLTVQGTAADAPSGLKIVTCNALPATMTGSSFTCTTPLNEGPNSVLVIAVDLAGNETRSLLHVVRDTTAPFLAVDSPAAGATTNAAAITIKGRVADVGGLVSLTAGGQPVTVTAGNFTLDVPLTEGPNRVELVAIDRAGNISRATATATRFSVPSVNIDSPADLALIRTVSVPVRGTVSTGVTSVLVNGVPATLSGNAFQASDVPLSQGRTVVTASASTTTGATATASVNLYRDSIPPRLDVYSPKDGATVYSPSVSISGMVDDIVVGTINAGQVRVSVNGIEAEVANRAFLLANVPLSHGANTLLITATDQGGNSTVFSYHITYAAPPSTPRLEAVSGNGQRAAIGAALPQPVTVRVVDGSGNPVPNRAVAFNVIENDGQLSAGTTSGRSVNVLTDTQGQASVGWILGTRAGAGNNRIETRGDGLGSPIEFDAVATTGQPHLIVVDSGNDQFAVVGASLPRPLVAVVVDAGSNRLANVSVKFSVIRGGGNFNGQSSIMVQTDSDGRAIALPVLGSLPGQDNHRFSASVAGVATTANFHASGRTAGAVADTRISGVVLDNSSIPVPGVSVRIEGTSLMTQSNAQGQFVVNSAPVGYAKLIIDGSTAQRPGTWPMLEFSLFALPGNDNTIGMPIYLLPVDVQRGLQVNETVGGTLTLPELPGFSLTIAPGSVTFPGGSRTGTVSATLVHADKMPMTPGFGQQPRFLVTIQPPGAHFDPPAAISFPNVDGLAPGAVTEMYSFDHDLGQFVAIGTGSISADGTVLRSDPGVGIIKGGWHCGGNPAQPGTSASCPECQTCDGENCLPDPGANGSGCTPKDSCTETAFCQDGSCQQIPKTCPECKKCKDGNCGPDELQESKPCTNPDKCTVNVHCEKGVCKGDPIDLSEWKADSSAGGEVTVPDAVIDKINALFSHVPGFQEGRLQELTVGASGKSKDCCGPESGRVSGGIKEFSGKVSLTATFPLPVGWAYDAIADIGIALVDIEGEAVLEVSTPVSVNGEFGHRSNQCKNESCAFGTLNTEGAIDVKLKLTANACAGTETGQYCLGKITIVPAGIKVGFKFGVNLNKEECGSGFQAFSELDKIVLHAEFQFHFLGVDWKYEWEHDWQEAYSVGS